MGFPFLREKAKKGGEKTSENDKITAVIFQKTP